MLQRLCLYSCEKNKKLNKKNKNYRKNQRKNPLRVNLRGFYAYLNESYINVDYIIKFGLKNFLQFL